MPRDAVILSTAAVTIEPVLEAAALVTTELTVRTLFGRAVLQVVDSSGCAVLSIQNSARVTDGDEIGRLLPTAPSTPLPIWWTEAVVPWGPTGDVGARILAVLAGHLGATLVLEDVS